MGGGGERRRGMILMGSGLRFEARGWGFGGGSWNCWPLCVFDSGFREGVCRREHWTRGFRWWSSSGSEISFEVGMFECNRAFR